MNRRLLVALAGGAGAGLVAGAAFGTAQVPVPAAVSGATPRHVAVQVRESGYPVYNAAGRRVGSATWRISPAGGNCCEAYVSATPTGRVVESGGTYPWYSDDRGRTWYQVTFDIPDQNDNGQAVAGGEGAAVVGPHGDVFGVTWDAYSGDHTQAYRYTASTGSWEVAEVPLKSPFYDRPWLTYASGPFTVDGTDVGAVLDMYGGGLTKSVDTLSRDGLDYDDASIPYADENGAKPVRFRIPVTRNPDADWWQPHPWAETLPLSGGGLLRFDNNVSSDEYGTISPGCAVARLLPTSDAWQCVSLRGALAGIVRQDSRGYLTEVYPTDLRADPEYQPQTPADPKVHKSYRALVLATSRDGGLHWSSVTLRPPSGAGRGIEAGDLFDVVANGRLGQAVVTARFDDRATQQGAVQPGHDMVFRVDTRHAQPRLVATYLVGKGDITTYNDVSGSAGYRFDYPSVALLPDGKIAVAFDDSTCVQPTLRDSTHRSPEVAILE